MVGLLSLAFAAWMALRFTVRLSHVPTRAMLPTIHPGDYVWWNPFAYTGDAKPKVGEVAVYRTDALFIKRVVAGPGDTIEMRNNVVFLNQKRREERYIILDPEVPAVRSFGPVTVPANSYFFLGDNRDNSNDSRFQGSIDENRIVGRMVYVLHVGNCDG